MYQAAPPGMIPYNGIYAQPQPQPQPQQPNFFFKLPIPHQSHFKMPRVVTDQKFKFDNDELFRGLRREGEIRYTGFKQLAMEERRTHFQTDCLQGHAEISFIASGTNLQLVFNANQNPFLEDKECDFGKEQGKVHLKSFLIMNGVSVRFRGWIDLQRLDGTGCLEFDERCAKYEDAILREQINTYNKHMRAFEDSKKVYRDKRTDEKEALRFAGLGDGAMGGSMRAGMWGR